MAPKFTYLNELGTGKIDWNLKVRVINLWNVPVRNAPHETQSIEMILLDAKSNIIGATVPKSWVPLFTDCLQEGSTYLIQNVTVAQNNIKYKKTSHKFKINFMRTTKISIIPSEDIPLYFFDFSEFSVILAENRSDLIVDVIGHVVEKDNLKEMEKDGRRSILLDLVLEDLSNNRVNCTLWGPYARRMQTYLDLQSANSTNEPVVVVIQLGRISNYLGVNGVSSGFYGTKLMINEDLPVINEYKSSLLANGIVKSQPVGKMVSPTILSIQEELLNTPKMTIADLVDSTKECFGSVIATVVDINTEKGWYYNACNKCFKVVGLVEKSFYCGHCRDNVTVSPRYKLNFEVIDTTGSTTLTIFNALVATFIGMSAEALIRLHTQRPNQGHFPEEFNNFLDKSFLFKVQVADINVRKGWQTYTVKKFSSDESLIKEFVQKNIIYGSQDEHEAETDGISAKLAENIPVIILDDEAPVNTDANTKGTDPIPIAKRLNFDSDTPIKKEPGVASFEGSSIVDPNSQVMPDFRTPEADGTPPVNNFGKRNVSAVEGLDVDSMEFSPQNAQKMPKKLHKLADRE